MICTETPRDSPSRQLSPDLQSAVCSKTKIIQNSSSRAIREIRNLPGWGAVETVKDAVAKGDWNAKSTYSCWTVAKCMRSYRTSTHSDEQICNAQPSVCFMILMVLRHELRPEKGDESQALPSLWLFFFPF